jgi:uncharacterized protein (DUF362 family)
MVALRREREVEYPRKPPFDPPEAYPEYPFARATLQVENRVYPMIRELFLLLGLDRSNFGTRDWNPLGEFISQGDKVVIKPNFVTDLHRDHPDWLEAQLALFTHGSVLRPIVDYAFKACGEEGRITICDSPLEEPREQSFQNVALLSGAQSMVSDLSQRGVPVRLLDLRDGLHASFGSIRRTKSFCGDPLGYSVIDLGTDSLLEEIVEDYKRFETGEWKKVDAYHYPGHHLYSIANTVLDADVFINVPKLKTHKKTGVTLCLKNLMGISNRKDWIPHWRRGVDEHKSHDPFYVDLLKSAHSVNSRLWQIALDRISSLASVQLDGHGNWHGNDTIWRVQVNLNKILFFADRDGVLRSEPQRRYFAITDGIIAGEGNSPLSPSPRLFGVVFGGVDPVAVSRVGCELMRVEYRLVKQLVRSASLSDHVFSHCDVDRICVVGDDVESCAETFEMADNWEILVRGSARSRSEASGLRL